MASDIWLRTILIVWEETRCHHIGYSYRLTARVLLYAPSHRQDSTYRGLCYTSCGALAWAHNKPVPNSNKAWQKGISWIPCILKWHEVQARCPGHTTEREREREMFYLTRHSTHFIYGYMASDIWLRTILIVREETRCRHIGYSYRLTAWVLLYAPSHRQDSTFHDLCYTSRGALAWAHNKPVPNSNKETRLGRQAFRGSCVFWNDIQFDMRFKHTVLGIH